MTEIFVIKAESGSKNVQKCQKVGRKTCKKSGDSGPIEIFGIIPKVSVMIEICSFSCKNTATAIQRFIPRPKETNESNCCDF